MISKEKMANPLDEITFTTRKGSFLQPSGPTSEAQWEGWNEAEGREGVYSEHFDARGPSRRALARRTSGREQPMLGGWSNK